MKKLLVIAAIAAFATSCKKDYTCECTTTTTTYVNGVATVDGPHTSSGKTGKMKKDDAKTKCEKSNGTTTSGDTNFGGKIVVSCSIK